MYIYLHSVRLPSFENCGLLWSLHGGFFSITHPPWHVSLRTQQYKVCLASQMLLRTWGYLKKQTESCVCACLCYSRCIFKKFQLARFLDASEKPKLLVGSLYLGHHSPPATRATFRAGHFDTPSLAELRAASSPSSVTGQRLRVRNESLNGWGEGEGDRVG